MNIETRAIEKNQKQTLLNLYQLYIYEFTPYFTIVLNSEGLYDFNAEQIDKYWFDSDHWPYFIHVDGELAGFCLLRKYPDSEERYDVEQFFVLTPYKRRGVGFTVFNSLVNTYSGKWQVRVMESNLPALQFWRSCIDKVAQSSLTERKLEFGTPMYFLKFE